MKIKDAVLLFERNSVTPSIYNGSGNDQCFGAKELNNKWVVFYMERGAQQWEKHFDSEEAAADVLINGVAEHLSYWEKRQLNFKL